MPAISAPSGECLPGGSSSSSEASSKSIASSSRPRIAACGSSGASGRGCVSAVAADAACGGFATLGKSAAWPRPRLRASSKMADRIGGNAADAPVCFRKKPVSKLGGDATAAFAAACRAGAGRWRPFLESGVMCACTRPAASQWLCPSERAAWVCWRIRARAEQQQSLAVQAQLRSIATGGVAGNFVTRWSGGELPQMATGGRGHRVRVVLLHPEPCSACSRQPSRQSAGGGLLAGVGGWCQVAAPHTEASRLLIACASSVPAASVGASPSAPRS